MIMINSIDCEFSSQNSSTLRYQDDMSLYQEGYYSPAMTGATSISASLDPPKLYAPVLFPWKLHEMLDNSSSRTMESVVSWLPQKNAFRVHNVKNFMDTIMPKYFKQTKYRSFQRQLNMWGFERINCGPHKGGYFHKYFVRGNVSLCNLMRRQKIKGVKGGQAAHFSIHSQVLLGVGSYSIGEAVTRSPSSSPHVDSKHNFQELHQILPSAFSCSRYQGTTTHTASISSSTQLRVTQSVSTGTNDAVMNGNFSSNLPPSGVGLSSLCTTMKMGFENEEKTFARLCEWYEKQGRLRSRLAPVAGVCVSSQQPPLADRNDDIPWDSSFLAAPKTARKRTTLF
jgi:HSF-type DNA-binding